MPEHERITRAQIEAKRADYAERYAAFRKDGEIDADFIHSTTQWAAEVLDAYIAGFPKGFRIKALPIARMAVEAAKNTVMAGEVPDVQVSLRLAEGEEPSAAQEARRKKTEQFTHAWLYEVAMRSAINPFSEMFRKVYGLGPGILSFPWDAGAWPADEEARRDAWPWRVEAVHPFNVMPDPYNDPPRDYIVADEIALTSARAQYPELALPEGMAKVQRVAYCSEEWYAVYIGGQAVFGDAQDGVVENPMGMLWYELALSGMGESREDGDVVTLWQGLVRPLREIIAMIITNYNIAEAVKFKKEFSPGHVTGPSEEEAVAAAARIEIGAFKVWATKDDIKYKPLFDLPPSPTGVWEQGELNRWLEILIGPQILSGNYQENTASGLAQRVSLQQAPFQSGKVSVEQAVGNMLRKVVRFYKTQIGAFYLRSQGRLLHFRPEDLLEDAEYIVDMKPVTAADRALAVDRDLKELQSGAISRAEYRRRQAIENGAQQDKDRALEGLLFHPAIIDAVAQAIIRQIAPPPVQEATPPAQESYQVTPEGNGAQPSLLESLRYGPVPSGPGR